jgi:hypothetical protein
MGNHLAIEVTPGRLPMQAKKNPLCRACAFIKVVQTKTVEAIQVVEVVGVEPIPREAGKALLRCAKNFHGFIS